MKLVKLLPTFAAAAVLAACSTVSDVASSTANIEGNAGSTAVDSTTAAKNITTGSKTVTYTCSVNGKTNQPVSAVYTFNNGEPSTATVTINKKVVGENLKVDATYQDGVKFVSGTNVWSLDIGFSAKTAETTVPVMFTANNQILAKNCVVTK
ncbi:Holliday junction resolvase [Glaesserella parasuis]|uniref:Holliday junction resolvase n=1 Tax=Glaesserella parasuis TaxID=738 RepID=UPI00094FDF68|nr:Holliday junction resolvase [Glaesserella parasuis]MDG6235758.1 Holliday junction resolvase [Glaesserella parasuis]MDG6263849.1 Holliday junction resolvase [Glaesserella parasuis]MDG6265611.1 Holliday junction resolvase [Glaesserella parasuis]MDG6284561.1 Holliday junction resolvase [Glaesserella parasuis]MDG6286720.1 Holliday junction resolvase [Glaesserella parasuis]